MQLTSFPLPLESGAPPTGYAGSERALSDLSTTTAFDTALHSRDILFGKSCCIICGIQCALTYCHIIPKIERYTWVDLMQRGWLPQQVKYRPHHEPRNGVVLCANHRFFFEEHCCFIRFFPNIKKYILIDYSDRYNEELQPYHGKAVALDIADNNAPFPSLFIIHEMRVRGFHPFHNTSPEVPADNAIDWQDWVITKGAWDDTRSQFHRREPHGSGAPGLPQMPSMPPTNSSAERKSSASGTQRLELNEKVIADILAATHAMPSWKECEREGTKWTGTAEENKQKYLSISQDS